MCQAISREHDAWAITRENNREDIEAAMREEPNPHLHFRYTDLPRWARFWKKGERGIRLYYYLWQFAMLRATWRLIRAMQFDLAHHVTFVNDYFFTGLALQPLPFVWGPIGSPGKRLARAGSHPLKFCIARTGYFLRAALRTCDPLFWLSLIRARLIIGINDDVGRRFPIFAVARDKFISHPAIGVERELTVACAETSQADCLEILSMGRLIPIKGFDLAIEAFALLVQAEPRARLTIVGSGQLQPLLARLAVELGVTEKVQFVANVPRPRAMELMGRAHVFLFPSGEAEGMVVLEALAQGLPVVCLAYGGPGNLVTPQCGFVVEPGAGTPERLATALSQLAHTPGLRRRMGVAAREHVIEHYLWETRHVAIRQWYELAGMPRSPT